MPGSTHPPFATLLGPAPAAVPARSVPIREVPRAAVEALVVRLTAEGFRHVVTSEGSPYGR